MPQRLSMQLRHPPGSDRQLARNETEFAVIEVVALDEQPFALRQPVYGFTQLGELGGGMGVRMRGVVDETVGVGVGKIAGGETFEHATELFHLALGVARL